MELATNGKEDGPERGPSPFGLDLAPDPKGEGPESGPSPLGLGPDPKGEGPGIAPDPEGEGPGIAPDPKLEGPDVGPSPFGFHRDFRFVKVFHVLHRRTTNRKSETTSNWTFNPHPTSHAEPLLMGARRPGFGHTHIPLEIQARGEGDENSKTEVVPLVWTRLTG